VVADRVERRLAAILSADVAGYSRLMAADESGTIRNLGDRRETVGLLVRQHRGRVVDAPGDNLLAEFPSALDAVESAIEIQRVMGARNADVAPERRMEFRIGLHLGDVAVEEERLYGDGVNIAARLEGLAETGGICLSDAVRGQVQSRLGLSLEDLGEQSLKNIPQPIRAWQLRLDGAPADNGVDPDARSFSGRPAIAVMAFDNMSGDPDQAYFADGISEDLITLLSSYRSFPVIARNSSFVYKGKAVDLKQVSRDLGARYIVEGSVRKVGDRVRITAQAIDATSGHHVWSERYDRKLDDIFAVQDEITESIVASFFGELFHVESKRVGGREPASLDAWECAHRGSFHMIDFTREGNATAKPFFQRATELDPQLVAGHFGLAMTHHLDVIYQWTQSPGDTIAALSGAAQNAIRHCHGDGQSYVALGLACSLTGQQEKMLDAFRKAIELNPSSHYAHFWLGTYLAVAGRSEEAIEHLERAQRLSPHDPMSWSMYYGTALAQFGAGRYEQAIAQANKSLQLRPDQSITLRVLAASLAHLDRIDEARAAFREMRRIQPEFSMDVVKLIFSNSPPGFLERYIEGLRRAGWEE
jgi:adenylate cyclase